MSYGLAQARYASDAAHTVSPGRLLTMLYDRLITDLTIAEDALRTAQYATAGERLGNAQEILWELHATLNTTVWPEGQGLAKIYLWVVGELLQARARQDPEQVATCRVLLEPLRDAWRQASQNSTAQLVVS
ncbi:MAG: flagellar secretion chaperone FliS [Actinomycetota bacterium]|nr:flagellar secretion chaperone FliS [Actinomycetota bacterium]